LVIVLIDFTLLYSRGGAVRAEEVAYTQPRAEARGRIPAGRSTTRGIMHVMPRVERGVLPRAGWTFLKVSLFLVIPSASSTNCITWC
jgi:hypothetical protein